jgi:hypothetical protein
MKITPFFILFFFASLVIGQSNDIVINTNRPFIQRLDVDLFSDPSEIGFNELDYLIDRVTLGRIKIYYFNEDTICFRIKSDLPIMISGLKSYTDSKIVINKIPRIDYNPIDSLWTSTVKYFDKDSLDLSTQDTVIYVPNNSTKSNFKLETITINKIKYYPEIISIPTEFGATYCKPGEFSTEQYIKKVEKFLHYKINKN